MTESQSFVEILQSAQLLYVWLVPLFTMFQTCTYRRSSNVAFCIR